MPSFVLFLLAYWYLYVYIRLVLYLPIYGILVYIYAWFCAILTCVLVLVYIHLVLCHSYLPIYWYLVDIRLGFFCFAFSSYRHTK